MLPAMRFAAPSSVFAEPMLQSATAKGKMRDVYLKRATSFSFSAQKYSSRSSSGTSVCFWV